jgi:hypothetical protein
LSCEIPKPKESQFLFSRAPILVGRNQNRLNKSGKKEWAMHTGIKEG